MRKNEPPRALAAADDLRHHGLEIVPVGAQAMHPDDRGVGIGRRLDFDGFQHRGIGYKNPRRIGGR